jgi:hypothetical protein
MSRQRASKCEFNVWTELHGDGEAGILKTGSKSLTFGTSCCFTSHEEIKSSSHTGLKKLNFELIFVAVNYKPETLTPL